MRLTIVAAAALIGLAPVQAADTAALQAALLGGDDAAMHKYVEDHYRDAGASLHPQLEWIAQPFDEVVNWYHQYEISITLAVFPRTTAEVTRYWDNWAELLTRGAWDWRAFFADDAEAALMANYNQFVLAAHEYGHALTYRYDRGHEQRMDNAINCREYYADRLAAGLLEEVAEALAAMRSRYVALMAAINAQVPVDSRYETPEFAALDADCRVMNVVQPTAETMTPYASAFFVRQGLLHAQDLPPLSEMYERYLFPRLAETRLPASGLAGPVTTLERLDGVSAFSTPSPLKYGSRLFAFAPDGSLFAVDVSDDNDSRPPRYRFAYGPARGPIEEVVPVRSVEGFEWEEGDYFSLESVVSMGPDRFLVMSSDNWFDITRQLLFDVRRGADGTWSVAIRDMDETGASAFTSRIFTNARGQLFLFHRRAGTPTGPYSTTYDWERNELDPQTLDVIATETFPAEWDDAPIGTGFAGETYFGADYGIAVDAGDGNRRAFAGSGLQGLVDSDDPLKAEFIYPEPLWIDPAGGILVLDYVDGSVPVIRHVATAAPEPAAPADDEEEAPPPPPGPERPDRLGW